jgi:hypothetical protein
MQFQRRLGTEIQKTTNAFGCRALARAKDNIAKWALDNKKGVSFARGRASF